MDELARAHDKLRQYNNISKYYNDTLVRFILFGSMRLLLLYKTLPYRYIRIYNIYNNARFQFSLRFKIRLIDGIICCQTRIFHCQQSTYYYEIILSQLIAMLLIKLFLPEIRHNIKHWTESKISRKHNIIDK